jgi:hypothetical protein
MRQTNKCKNLFFCEQYIVVTYLANTGSFMVGRNLLHCLQHFLLGGGRSFICFYIGKGQILTTQKEHAYCP